MLKLESAVRPGVIFVVPLLVSAAAWAVPGESTFLRGFSQRTQFTAGGLIILVAWYCLCFIVFSTGMKVGRSVTPLKLISSLESTSRYEVTFLRILTILATVGVAYSLFLAQQQGSILAALAQNSGNDLSEPLKDGAGLATTRYTTVIAAPFAIALWLRKRSPLGVAVWNVALLFTSSLFSSRMSLVMAVVLFGFLYSHDNPGARIKLSRVAGAGLVVFCLLGVLNFFRNAKYYVVYGVDNPLLMNCYQILSYLGAPFQVSEGVAGSIFQGTFPDRGDFVRSLQILIPTFFQDKNAGSVIGSDSLYANQVDVAGNLTTNSAFADMYNTVGTWGLLWSLIAVLVAGMIYGHCKQYKSGMVLGAGLALYLLAEYWRIFLFNQGIVVYLFLIIFISAFVSVWATSARLEYETHSQPRRKSVLLRR
ncbi:hypothetical protein [Arthrobacter sp. NA-172]|uniref:hypothetical protein n=1 Tax=Arthrobacter sp. NA-172 TaxID=3367524 RepID=UPI0037542EFE